MTTVRAKFKVTAEGDVGDGRKTVGLTAVVDGSDENSSFFRYTPSGSIQLSTINAEAAKQFVMGKECYVDFVFTD